MQLDDLPVGGGKGANGGGSSGSQPPDEFQGAP
jgi:hypothetical protein